WEFMHAQSEGLLLHQCLTQRHVDATLDLADDQHRVDRSTDVMRDPYFGHPDLTGLYVDIDLHHRGRVGVGRTRANPGALVRSGELGGRIATVTGDNSVLRLG